MRAHSQNDRVPTELEIEGGYLSIVLTHDGTRETGDGTSTVNEASAEALVDARVWRPPSKLAQTRPRGPARVPTRYVQ